MATAPRLLAITSGRPHLDRLGWLDELIADGVDALQVREKQLADGDLLRLVARLVERAAGRLTVWVNRRADIAAAAGADGVHLPGRGVPTAAIRRSFPDLLVGRSTHQVEEVLAAAAEGAHYVTFGPVCSTPSKARYGPPRGFDALRSAARVAGSLPVLALGGVDPSAVGPAFEAGARGVAGIRVFADRDARRRLVAVCGAWWGDRGNGS